MTRQEYYLLRQAEAIQREHKIIEYLRQGKTRKEIADILHVAPCQVSLLHTRYIEKRKNRDLNDIYSNLTIKTCMPLRTKGLVTKNDILKYIFKSNELLWPRALRKIPNLGTKGVSEVIDWLVLGAKQ